MPKAKEVVEKKPKTTRKAATKPATPVTRKPRSSKAPAAPRRSSTKAKPAAGEPQVAQAQAQAEVVASKFAPTKARRARPLRKPSLPASYGESHLLLLARDPETLFAAWDMAPEGIEAIKARIGKRAFAVSTLTLRLTRAGGTTSLTHVGKKSRSKYLKIEGGPSFMAEIGFTTPAGRFEFIARSAPCFTPMGAPGRQGLLGGASPPVLSYREARARARARRGQSSVLATADSAPGAFRYGAFGSGAAGAQPSAARTIGGASDLYRR